MSAATAIGLVLAFASTILTNLGYLREHEAAAALPPLSMGRPLESARLLVTDRTWMLGFAMETSGFLLYAAALALTELALVQSIGAGGIGVLAFVSARLTGRLLSRRELLGVVLSVLGLAALGVSLAGGSEQGRPGSTAGIVLWLGASAAAATLVLAAGRGPVANGIAGGLLFSIGDVSTKVVTEGGARMAFVVTLVLGYLLGTARLQLGYQAGGALTVAGLATLLTNAVPIAAGTVVLNEPIPHGALGGLRIAAFAALTAGGFLLAEARVPRRPAAPRDGGRAAPASRRGRS